MNMLSDVLSSGGTPTRVVSRADYDQAMEIALTPGGSSAVGRLDGPPVEIVGGTFDDRLPTASCRVGRMRRILKVEHSDT